MGDSSISHGIDADCLAPGAVFADRYRIERRLGEGSRKWTYLARDALLDERPVALSVTKPGSMQVDPGGTQREVSALAKVGSHDNIVSLYDTGTASGYEYVVIAFMSEGTLRDYLRRCVAAGELPSVEDVLKLGRQIARALAHLHAHGLIHRDVAPSNIWLDERRVAHLGDLDSAVSISADHDDGALPSTSEAYQPPEVLAGAPGDVRADLYALGAVLFEISTGQRPGRRSPGQIAERLAAREPELPSTLQTVIRKLLAPDPRDRPSSADAVLPALHNPRGPAGGRQGVLAWAQTLPFPLASVLWHCDGAPEPTVKVDYLLKFFEVLAHFSAMVQLSAGMSDPAVFAERKNEWFGSGPHAKERRLDLRRATFGSWIELDRRLASSGRAQLASDHETVARYLSLFSASDSQLAEVLTSPTLIHLLTEARDRRNIWSGHGGAAGSAIHQARLRELEALLADTRAHLGWSFEPWTLFKPGPMVLEHGTYDITATILTGTNPAFGRRQLTLAHPVDAGRLYLLREGSQQALQLVPLIKIMAGPKSGQDACYVYSQLVGHDVRWISYHHHAEPELSRPDDDVTAFLAALAE